MAEHVPRRREMMIFRGAPLAESVSSDDSRNTFTLPERTTQIENRIPKPEIVNEQLRLLYDRHSKKNESANKRK